MLAHEQTAGKVSVSFVHQTDNSTLFFQEQSFLF